MPLVLSTKLLTPIQKKHLLLANIGLVEYDALRLTPMPVDFENQHFEHSIFTSQYAVELAISHKIRIKNAYCVGLKTAEKLKTYAENIIMIKKNANELANEIIDKYGQFEFNFFCSKQRRHELPTKLDRKSVKLYEHHLYDTIINPLNFQNNFDAVLCFSPLGVKAYYLNHRGKKPLAICIGGTTAQEASNYTDFKTSKKNNIDSVISKAIKLLK